MNLWFVLAINSITLGGLLFLLSAGFSLIFGLMKIPNLTHGSFFMLGAYLATSLLARGFDFWTAAVAAGLLVAALGGIVERLILRRLPGAELAQVLVTLGLSFMIADACLMVWTGDPIQVATPGALRGATSVGWLAFPTYRLAIAVIAVVFAAGLWALLDRTRLGAMIRAGVDDPEMARARRRAGGAHRGSAVGRLHLLREHRQPDLDRGDLRPRHQRAGRLRRAGHARSRRLVRHRGLRRGPDHEQRSRSRGGRRRRDRAHARGRRRLRGAGPAGHRARLRHDHGGARSDRVGHRLSVDQHHERRQRDLDQGAPEPAGAVARVPGGFLLGDTRRLPRRRRLDGALRGVTLRR